MLTTMYFFGLEREQREFNGNTHGWGYVKNRNNIRASVPWVERAGMAKVVQNVERNSWTGHNSGN